MSWSWSWWRLKACSSKCSSRTVAAPGKTVGMSRWVRVGPGGEVMVEPSGSRVVST